MPMNRYKYLLSMFVAVNFLAACTALGANPGASQSPAQPSGSVIFQDDFAQPTTGWDRFLVNEGVMDYDGGGYRILVNALQMNFWSTPHKSVADVRLEVDAGKLAGPDENRIGLICRSNGKDYYFFLISSDGYYGVGLFKDDQVSMLGQSEMLNSTNINMGLAINHLRADCVGDTLTFYVNGFEVAKVKDTSLTSGDFGILAGTFTTPGVDVVFDNFVALQP